MSRGYSTNWDRNGWPGSEIQMYHGCPCPVNLILVWVSCSLAICNFQMFEIVLNNLWILNILVYVCCVLVKYWDVKFENFNFLVSAVFILSHLTLAISVFILFNHVQNIKKYIFKECQPAGSGSWKQCFLPWSSQLWKQHWGRKQHELVSSIHSWD